ncbi:MAG: S8 family serine peptidase, partial [Acidobacteria bacterium]|nr:S8 family serine peptidase [Acidobacteriota bacterium]
LYTNEQINGALKGEGTVRSMDNHGHGTATAGTAAANGRATANGVPAGSFKGVAPEADLIVIKAMDCEKFSTLYLGATLWIAQTAKALNRPSVINMSFGAQYGAHDGSEEEEQIIDQIVEQAKSGLAIAVAAGNEGRLNLHASGSFGAKQPGQADVKGKPIELFVTNATRVNGYFDHGDDWGIIFRGSNQAWVSTDGKLVDIAVYKVGDRVEVEAQGNLKDQEFFKLYKEAVKAKIGTTTDTLILPLPPGRYYLWGMGSTDKVKSGRFSLYLPESTGADVGSFGMGTEKKFMIGSPGNASNVITVGSFDFRGSWLNQSGQQTVFNLTSREISDYSSPGFRRDGVIKPDIAAPARYTISSLSQGSKSDSGGCQKGIATAGPTHITRDGFHIAWAGTSAATPFTAGVIALMLQKNSKLDTAQIRSILTKTALKGDSVGAVPNPLWGYGRINPEAALRSTPATTTLPRRRRRA